MTISDLKRALEINLQKVSFVQSAKNDMGIYLGVKDWNTAKYACTTEEHDFKFIKGQVFYKGWELKKVSV